MSAATEICKKSHVLDQALEVPDGHARWYFDASKLNSDDKVKRDKAGP